MSTLLILVLYEAQHVDEINYNFIQKRKFNTNNKTLTK